jgi:hypothetical protein
MRLCGLGLVAALIGASLPAMAQVCTPSISFTETFNVTTQTGQYIVSTGDLCGLGIVGFAVDNNQTVATSTARTHWGSDVVTRDEWDGGFQALFGTPGPDEVLFATGAAGIGTFDAFFDASDTQANVYWINSYIGLSTCCLAQIGDFETTPDQFFFHTTAPASDLVAILSDGTTMLATPAAVPAPAGLPLLALGLFGLAALRRRG